MTDVPQPNTRASLAVQIFGALLIAATLSLIFVHALAAYWQFYHLGTGGSGLFLIYFALPGSMVVSTLVVFFVARARFQRGTTMFRSLTVGAGFAALILAFLLGLEITSTTAARSGEGPGAGNLAPYLLHHFGVRR